VDSANQFSNCRRLIAGRFIWGDELKTLHPYSIPALTAERQRCRLIS
jgi:hypothetical protein